MAKDGHRVTKPWPLVRAELVDGLCRRWGCLPSQLYQEDAHEVLQTILVLGLAAGQGGESEGSQESDLGFDMRTLEHG